MALYQHKEKFPITLGLETDNKLKECQFVMLLSKSDAAGGICVSKKGGHKSSALLDDKSHKRALQPVLGNTFKVLR